jgi:hypothetical protein
MLTRWAIFPLGCILVLGCSAKNHVSSEPQVIVIRDKGTQVYAWEEPIVDVITIPAGLDPEGIYYRPEHQQIVEIKQGRWVLKE